MAPVQGPAASLRVAGGKGVLQGEDGVLQRVAGGKGALHEEDGVDSQSGWLSRYRPKCGTVKAIWPRSAE